MSKIVGFQRVTGTNKQGQAYSGYRIFVTENRDRVQGLACEDVYVGDQFMPAGSVFSVGDEIEFVYNKFGRVQGVKLLSASSSGDA